MWAGEVRWRVWKIKRARMKREKRSKWVQQHDSGEITSMEHSVLTHGQESLEVVISTLPLLSSLVLRLVDDNAFWQIRKLGQSCALLVLEVGAAS